MNTIPPEFCWKKGGDLGRLSSECPSGYNKILTFCYAPCKEGYAFKFGLCYKSFRDTYVPVKLAGCLSNEYAIANICYRDCKVANLTNCGTGACAKDLGRCASGLLNIA